ncbi:DUF1642 domain-containing protein [Listeria ivanovii]|uniref:DUF1642 domain-containing protein n=1 Tax=Listeria ivanovii TaxID=1638 RepID=UPI001905C973|nr:DUF1642 domain-containing protein [Listeria ivanovii]MBK1985573.1 DUF1642 domain-containing protein [Listeria ivanovii subsp. londoniensis]
MKFKKGDRVQFIEENQLITGQITGINIFSKDNFNYSVDVNVGSYIVSFTMAEDELVLAKPLVTIPQFVANNIEEDKDDGGTLYKSLHYIVEYLDEDSEMYTWLEEGDNGYIYAKAWLDGYEIEKEPLYYVKLLDDDVGYLNLIEGNGNYFLGNNRELYEYKAKFTEQEIKEMDERFWQFAIPVEESEGN